MKSPWVLAPNAVAQATESDAHRTFRILLTEQLRIVLEDRAVRIGVVGMLLVFASAFTMVPMPEGIDAAWMFIVPVAISSIAAGLAEGLVVALAASILFAVYATVGNDQFLWTQFVGIVTARFALYGLTSGVLGAFSEAHQSVESDLRELASKDPLTMVANVTSFYKELGVLEASAAPSFAVLIVDIDDLKHLNDQFGHQTGSAAIKILATTLKRVVRASDCVARYGGDEFVVILNEADRAGARIVTNRLRQMLAAEPIPGAPNEVLSVSVGVSLFGEDGKTSEELLAAADAAMYAEKRRAKTSRQPVPT